MSLTVVLEDEHGQAIQILPDDFDYRVLNEVDLNDFLLLKYIDFYGDTTFNSLQADDLIDDFDRLKTTHVDQESIIQHIIDLCRICKQEVHTYIKFYGD